MKKKKKTFQVSVTFDRKQHKCDPQMNNTRGLNMYPTSNPPIYMPLKSFVMTSFTKIKHYICKAVNNLQNLIKIQNKSKDAFLILVYCMSSVYSAFYHICTHAHISVFLKVFLT